MLPVGNYRIKWQGEETTRTYLPAASYILDLRPGKILGYKVSASSTNKGEVIVHVDARGDGNHQFKVRTDNLTLTRPEKTVMLKTGITASFEWRCRIANPDMPWVVVIIPDGDHSLRQEAHGAAWE